MRCRSLGVRFFGPVAAIGLVVSACGGESRDSSLDSGAAISLRPDEQQFCDALSSAFSFDSAPEGSPGEEAYFAALDQAPSELDDVVALLRQDPTEEPTEAQKRGLEDFTLWIDRHCVAAATFAERIAPATPPGDFFSCGNTGWITGMSASEPPGWVIIYGDASAEDPFAQRLVAVLTGVSVDPGDGPRGEAFVNGQPAVTGPPGLFQQVSSPELGQTVTWQIDGQDVTVLGRGYTESEVNDLVTLAETVSMRPDGRAVLVDPALDVLYDGDGAALVGLSPFVLQDPVYTVSYRRASSPAVVQVSAMQLTAAAFDASRAFIATSKRTSFHDQHGFFGAAWSDDTGPFIAAWQESDNIVVWISAIGLGVDQQTAVDVAQKSIRLTDEQWTAVNRASDNCTSIGP